MIIERFLEWVDTASVDRRAEATTLLVRSYLVSELDREDIESAEAAMTLLLEDPSPDVRKALGSALASSNKAPRHIIMALASDTEEISELIINRSPVFVDAELIDLVATGTVRQQVAIASRQLINPGVIGAIAEVACSLACSKLLENPNAKCTPRVLHRLAERFGDNGLMRAKLLAGGGLRADTRLLLIEKLGQSLKGFVTGKSWLPTGTAELVVREACDKASISFAANAEDDDLDSVVGSLISGGRISTSFLLRAICMGNITLVGRTLSHLAGIPSARVDAMMINDRKAAFRAVFVKAGLPETAFGVFYTAICTWRTLLNSNIDVNPAKLPYMVTRKVLDHYSSMETEIVDDLLLLLRKLAADTARASARSKVFDILEKSASERLALTVSEDIALTEEFMDEFSNAFDEEFKGADDRIELPNSDDIIAGAARISEIRELATAQEGIQFEDVEFEEVHAANEQTPFFDPVAPVVTEIHTGREIPFQIAA